MTVKRYNSFNITHKGLRLMLYQTALAIQQNDFTDITATTALLQNTGYVINTFEKHAGHEDGHIIPALEKCNAAMAGEYTREHSTDHELGTAVLNEIAAWHNAVDEAEKEAAGRMLFYAFNNFLAFNIGHMNREETELLPEMWKHYTDAELIAINRNVVAGIPPGEILEQNRWTFGAISLPEALSMLQNIQKSATEDFFNAFLKLAEADLTPEKWTVVKRELWLKKD